ncbi:MAG TPA: universal stress protein [Gemmatimonadales bacterium]
MHLRHILAATDESDAGRQAVRAALELASRSDARVTVVRVESAAVAPQPVGALQACEAPGGGVDDAAVEHLRRWLDADVLHGNEAGTVQLSVNFGIPGIEICRAAERLGADLLVLGRKRHSQRARLLLGDTADAVARRSRFPCLFVPPRPVELRNLLVALDGSDRGMTVLHAACGFARDIGAGLQVVTVERGAANEPWHLAAALPVARSSALQARVLAVAQRERIPGLAVSIQRGDITEAVLAQVRETGADGLAIGYHRGGPPGVIEAGSTARRLAHEAPCAVLTIPL